MSASVPPVTAALVDAKPCERALEALARAVTWTEYWPGVAWVLAVAVKAVLVLVTCEATAPPVAKASTADWRAVSWEAMVPRSETWVWMAACSFCKAVIGCWRMFISDWMIAESLRPEERPLAV